MMVQKVNSLENIWLQIQRGGEISPFLFLSPNLELLHSDIMSYIHWLLREHDIDKQSLFHISDSPESLKIDEVKKFLAQWEVKARFAFQVFFIENISRMTPQAQNSCLKFFEEPWKWNIIILTNSSQSGILDTILSRVQIISLQRGALQRTNEFYYDLIRSHSEQKSDELIRYMFSAKLEKTDYAEFLQTLVEYISNTGTHISLLDEIHEDINGILKNNLQGKYIADKYIMYLGMS